MLKSKSKIKFLLMLMLAALLISCSPKAPKSKDEIVVAIESNPSTLDPRMAMDANSVRISQTVYNSLIRKNEKNNLVPNLAEKWELTGDKTYIFYLRKGIKFHDGKELTAHDAAYTFNSILSEKFKSPHKGAYEQIDKIEVLDDYTVKFTLKSPFAPFLLNMTMGIVPRHLGDNPDFSRHPVGSGPFRFIEWQTDDKLIFERNNQYFEGSPKFTRLIYKIYPEEITRVLALKKGDIDFAQNSVSPDMLKQLETDNDLKIIKEPGTNYAYIGFNLRDNILQKSNVRRAIAHGINREMIIKYILGGLATSADSLLPADNPFFNKNLLRYGYDPELAKKLLDEAGLTDPDGDGLRFTLTFKTSQNELSRRIIEVMQEDLKKIGIGIEIKSYEWGSFFYDITSGNFQIYSLNWVGVTDPDIYYNIFHSQNIPPQGANRGFYSNKKLDILLEEGRITLDEAKRIDIYQEIQRIASDELPYISLWHSMNVAVMNKNLEGFKIYPAGDFLSLKDIYWGK